MYEQLMSVFIFLCFGSLISFIRLFFLSLQNNVFHLCSTPDLVRCPFYARVHEITFRIPFWISCHKLMMGNGNSKHLSSEGKHLVNYQWM